MGSQVLGHLLQHWGGNGEGEKKGSGVQGTEGQQGEVELAGVGF